MKKAPNQIDIHVGSRIRLGRTKARMTQEQLAEGLGITFQQVQKYEKGSNRVGASRLQHISELLNLPIIFFFEAGPSALVIDTADDASHRLSELMNSKETIALATAFHSIEDKHVRRSLLSLVRSLATSPPDPEEINGSDHSKATPI
ncbi:transcriptional regulator with XRE-family HTH domain [Neorhizobium sp. 2083]|uniref:helix-turn-helix domain-containing protein n=1 Tax=Neorhizobium sp. 2083 TaxID=2817762 RepID=UPI00285CB837|nr:helix-turn-helix transcriptional regulator [Neorhizobium sp. 2083]MDR6820410.1 transcriptional regulator with XRE-family HTH domain [Neorhizobium sp. 2083]